MRHQAQDIVLLMTVHQHHKHLARAHPLLRAAHERAHLWETQMVMEGRSAGKHVSCWIFELQLTILLAIVAQPELLYGGDLLKAPLFAMHVDSI